MFKSLTLGLAAFAAAAGAFTPTIAGAQAYGYPYGGGWDAPRYERAYHEAYRDGWNQGPRYYADRGSYAPRRCSSGTTGAVVGAIAGGLLGRAIDTRGDRSLGTILGAGGGLLAGRAVERSANPGWCR